MSQAFGQPLAIIASGLAFGVAWDRWMRGRGTRAPLPSTDELRRGIGRIVLLLLLPALVFRALLGAPLGDELWGIPLVAAASCLASCLAAWLVYDRWLLRSRLIERWNEALRSQ